MNNLRILHISDLHYSNSNKRELEYIKKALLLDVDNFIKEKKLIPNFIIFSGDLVFKPDEDTDKIEEFENAYNFIINPLLEKLTLTNNDIFITPGNHDINRKFLNRGDQAGLKAYTTDRDAVNELINEILKNGYELKHLQQFNKFLQTLDNKNTIETNELFNVYRLDLQKIKIGIVDLNSTILSFEDNTYGKLIIGEEQLRAAINKIIDCDIKIANIHHSINWLISFEQRLVKKFFYENFNLVFIGHEHMEQPELVNFNDEDTLILNSASLFQGRNNINGYSLLDYNFENKNLDIYVREYDDREHKFSTITFKNTENKYAYEFNILEKSKNKKNIELILDGIRENLNQSIKSELLINIAKNKEYQIEEIFVEPNIYTKSEFIDSNDDKELYTINKICNETKPIWIKGIESSGKTTLLNYIATEFLNMKASKLLIPVLLNSLDIQDILTDSILFAKTIDYFRKAQINITNKELEKLIRDGNIVFLIDNYKLTDSHKTNLLNLLQNPRFKNNKYILTSTEEIFNSIEDVNENISDNTYENHIELYLYNLKRDKARSYFQLYFNNQNFSTNDFEEIYKFIRKLNIPTTIFNYTLIAHVYENQKNSFAPMNEAYLLDIFMENLLEKFDIRQNLPIGSLGYNLKSSYLIYISKYMTESNIFILDKYKLIELTSKFIQELKREKEGIQIEPFIDYMIKKGIFVEVEQNKLRFRYNTFLEFFIAKGMLKDSELREKIINKENYLNFKNEIKYYSGLHGEDEELLIHFEKFIDQYKLYFENINKNFGDNIYIPDIDSEDNSEFQVEQISLEKKDKLIDVKPKHIKQQNGNKKIINKKDYNSDDKRIFETNILLANILRNSEQLRNPELKTKILKLVINNLSKFFQKNLNETSELEQLFVQQLKEEDIQDISDKDIKEFTSMMNIVFSQIFMGIAYRNIFSNSLFTIYQEILENNEDLIIDLLIVSMFTRSEDYKKINIIKETIKKKSFSNNRFLMMSLFFNIYHTIKVREIDNSKKNNLEQILTDIITGLKYNTLNAKGTIKKHLIESSKKEIKTKIQEALEK